MYCRAEQAKRNRLMAQKLMREVAAIERDSGSTPPACVVEAANVVMKYLGANFNTFRRIHTYRSGIASSTCGRDNPKGITSRTLRFGES